MKRSEEFGDTPLGRAWTVLEDPGADLENVRAVIRHAKRTLAPMYRARDDVIRGIQETHRLVGTGKDRAIRFDPSESAKAARASLFERLDEIGREIAPWRDLLERLDRVRKQAETDAEKAREALQRAKKLKAKGKTANDSEQKAFWF